MLQPRTAIALAVTASLWIALLVVLRRFQGKMSYVVHQNKLAKSDDALSQPKPAQRSNSFAILIGLASVFPLLLTPKSWVRPVVILLGGVPPLILLGMIFRLGRKHPGLGEQTRINELIHLGDPTQALRDAHESIETQGPSAIRWNSVGLALLALKRYGEAVPAFEIAASLNPADAFLLNNLAIAVWKMGDVNRAVGLMPDVLEKYPNDPVLRSNYCQMLVDAGQQAEAVNQLRRLEEILAATEYRSDEVRTALQAEFETCRKKMNGSESRPKDTGFSA